MVVTLIYIYTFDLNDVNQNINYAMCCSMVQTQRRNLENLIFEKINSSQFLIFIIIISVDAIAVKITLCVTNFLFFFSLQIEKKFQ